MRWEHYGKEPLLRAQIKRKRKGGSGAVDPYIHIYVAPSTDIANVILD